MKCVAFIFLLLSMSTQGLLARESVKLAIGEWPPYTSSENSRDKLLEKVVYEAFKLVEIDVTYDYYPWKRSYMLTVVGQYDGTFPWNKTIQRQEDFYIHKLPLLKDEGVYFHLKSNPFDWEKIEDLKPYKVGVNIGFKHVDINRKNGLQFVLVASEKQILKMILAGRLDVYRTSKSVGYTMINRIFTPEQAKLFTHHHKIIEEKDYFILFSKTTSRGKYLSEQFDRGLMKLKTSGAYDNIIAEYDIKSRLKVE